MLLEIKGLKFAENRDFASCLRGAVPAILSIAVASGRETSSGEMSISDLVRSIKKQLDSDSEWGNIILDSLIQNCDDE